ncbi:MAG: AEC family transporter [Clostridia bacterium]|nr:AEC family transporter [Clostridia bacterium]
MLIFNATLNQLLMILSLVLAGFVLRKAKLVPDNSHVILSKLETLVFLPALNFATQIKQCNPTTFKENSSLILFGALFLLIPIILALTLPYAIVKRKKRDLTEDYRRNIYKYAIAVSNYGFVGNFVILGIWGEELFFKYTLFTFSFNIACYALGLYLLIPRKEGDGFFKCIKRALLSPPLIAMILGIVFGLCGVSKYLPSFLLTALDNASSCMGPIAMLITGLVIGTYDIKSLLLDKRSYLMAFLRLVAIPSTILTIIILLGAPEELFILALVGFASPIGLNTIVFPAAYGGDTRPGASMVMISQILSVITIPLLYLIFSSLVK